MQDPAPFDSDLRPLVVDPNLAARLTFGNEALKQSITTLETTLRLFVGQFGGARKVFKLSGEELEDDNAVIRCKLAIARQLLGVRLGAHLTEIVESLSNQRALSVAQSVRAALETAGAAAYYEAKFRNSVADLPILHGQVDRALRGQRFAWEDWSAAIANKSREELGAFLQSQIKKERRPDIDQNSPPSVMTFIDALEEVLLKRLTEPAIRDGKPAPMRGHIRAIYSQLCDFVHPSVGSWKTYAKTDPLALTIEISSASRLEGLQFLWFGIGEYAAVMSLVGLQALHDIDALRTSLMRQNVKT